MLMSSAMSNTMLIIFSISEDKFINRWMRYVHVFFFGFFSSFTVSLLSIRSSFLLFLLIIWKFNLLDFSWIIAALKFVVSKIKNLFEGSRFSNWWRYSSTTTRINQGITSICSNQLANSLGERIILWIISWNFKNVFKLNILRIELLSINESINHVLNTWESPHLFVSTILKLCFEISFRRFYLVFR